MSESIPTQAVLSAQLNNDLQEVHFFISCSTKFCIRGEHPTDSRDYKNVPAGRTCRTSQTRWQTSSELAGETEVGEEAWPWAGRGMTSQALFSFLC
jgi:hypothetical protein